MKMIYLVALVGCLVGCRSHGVADHDAQAVADKSIHTLTWENYDGTGDKARAIYVLDGQRLDAGPAGLEKLHRRIAAMPRGAELRIVPYYTEGKTYPCDTYQLYLFAQEHGVVLGVPAAG